MSSDVPLVCSCGSVRGSIAGVSPETVNRVVCYCDDCQAYAHHLGRAALLDEHGGSDVVQVAPATLSFARGTEHIVAVRLAPKGLYRWTAMCCKTPLGNTLKPAIPFVGIPIGVFAEGDRPRFGEVVGRVMGKFAIGEPPPGSTGFPAEVIARSLRRVLAWKLRGRTWPHPYFDRKGTPLYPEQVLSKDERDRLRPLCGPKAT